MKIVGAILLVVIVGGGFLFFSKSPTNSNYLDLTDKSVIEVILSDNGFVPDRFSIKKGTKVVFRTNRGKQFWPASNIHPSHSIYSEFDPKRPLEPYEEWSFVFDNVGEWGFHDHIRSYFVGKIQVVE